MGRKSRIGQHRWRDVGDAECDGRRDDMWKQPAPYVALLKFMWVRNWLKGLQEAQ